MTASVSETSASIEGPSQLIRTLADIAARALPVAVIVGLCLVLEVLLRVFDVPSYIMPTPSAILLEIVKSWQLLWRHAQVTIIEAALGFALGNAVGVALAVAFLYSRTLERSLFPVAQTIRSIPVVALAPLFLLWFGNGMAPKVITAALICFFPTLVNTYRGLTSVDRLHVELMHSLAASPTKTFWTIRWPAALPYLFSALKIASATAIIGALVAEWIGSDVGLGYLVVTSTYEYRVEQLWATIVVTAALAIVAFEVIAFAERRIITWQSFDRADG